MVYMGTVMFPFISRSINIAVKFLNRTFLLVLSAVLVCSFVVSVYHSIS